ncbi:MAG TPA: DNA translocase FtsK 4TM domain-containing protein, partial [Elusimicrobiota bacterium]|nr:DNA translocase FtsK 4TM domain-containing protein [Elusimicrobiota bacterium]
MRSRLTAAAKRKRGKKGDSVFGFAFRAFLAVFGLIFLTWSLLSPASMGNWGLAIEGALRRSFGYAAFALPLLYLYGLLWAYRSDRGRGLILVSLGSATSLVGSAMFLSACADGGGIAGKTLADAARDALGQAGSVLVALGATLFGLQMLFSISWGKLLARTFELLADDFKGWRQGRKELKQLLDEATERAGTKTKEKKEKAAAPAPPAIAPIPEPAKLGAAPPELLLPPAPPVIEEPEAPKPKKSKKADAADTAAAPRTPAVAGEYVLPPHDLLTAKKPGAPTGRPSDAEIQEQVASLERALHSFEIQARVSGISPGPVITRYEVSPAPGVTVNSIVARADDIALAMRAKGIRMIAPIPGKAAIGIEIPNHQPATVTLRDVLESQALAHNKHPLAFALGLSSDGTPLAADLATMPHVLVAGATNSGKSVMVHSLIASILFRRRPDEVKFLLIDPKRIELSLYDGIPHLYDPKTPAQQVQVITMAKQASASLKALVTVMERRYEKFQLYKVRDIAAFNKEAERKGEPKEFHIVVVIDELADLMVVARDVVEDSIQRLTQMARAVGIHLVLATQRPSVDVVTGVIKANLPSRIAMRVASKVDSKVILDTVGAEALLGKGDTLYLAPGQDPARVQGCFVSTTEIGALVEYLKTQGVPDYPAMETMG